MYYEALDYYVYIGNPTNTNVAVTNNFSGADGTSTHKIKNVQSNTSLGFVL